MSGDSGLCGHNTAGCSTCADEELRKARAERDALTTALTEARRERDEALNESHKLQRRIKDYVGERDALRTRAERACAPDCSHEGCSKLDSDKYFAVFDGGKVVTDAGALAHEVIEAAKRWNAARELHASVDRIDEESTALSDQAYDDAEKALVDVRAALEALARGGGE